MSQQLLTFVSKLNGKTYKEAIRPEGRPCEKCAFRCIAGQDNSAVASHCLTSPCVRKSVIYVEVPATQGDSK